MTQIIESLKEFILKCYTDFQNRNQQLSPTELTAGEFVEYILNRLTAFSEKTAEKPQPPTQIEELIH